MTTQELLDKVQQSMRLTLELSRKIPMRACSPYGALMEDQSMIMTVARTAYESLLECETLLQAKFLAEKGVLKPQQLKLSLDDSERDSDHG